jgi:molybdopterin-guanine dinucleotide biosynthesis protein A
MSHRLNGLILCGGKSTRMGRDKSLISYHGKPQRDHLADLLKPLCSEVYFSVPKGTKATLTIIPDHFDFNSPLNGILSAFHFDPQAAWLTVPVDMPNIDTKIIQYLIRHRNMQCDATCFLDSEGENPEPLFTIWEAKSKPVLFDFFNNGNISPRKFLADHDVHMLSTSKNILVNINSPEEMAEYFRQSGKTIQGHS